MTTYSVHEIFYSLQGEGAQTGRAAIFLRFSRCNLWSGHEQDREKAKCKFCDTDFLGTQGPGGGEYASALAVAQAVEALWSDNSINAQPFVVCTGGEPLLQLDDDLVDALHAVGFEIAVESNGTCYSPDGVDWMCISPKLPDLKSLKIISGNEIKLVYPQKELPPEKFEDMDFTHFYLQPMDGPDLEENITLTAQYCLDHPQWKLSLQTHKIIGLP